MAILFNGEGGLNTITKTYIDEVASGLSTKPAVLAATTANLTATYANGTSGVGATLTATSNGAWPGIDGVTTGWALYNGVLVKDQTNKFENGRYFVSDLGDAGSPWVLTRCTFCDEADEIPGAYVFVQDGSTQAGFGYVAIVSDPTTFVVGTDDIDWFQFSGTSGVVTLTGTQTLTNKTFTSPTINDATVNTSALNRGLLKTSKEVITVSATAATGTVDVDVLTSSVIYYTSDASANWTFNIRGDGSNSLDSIMSTGEVLTLAFLVTNGGTAYYPTAIQIDGSGVTPEWQGGSAPTGGNTSSIDVYTFTVIKTGSATFTVLGAQTQFA